MHLLSRTRRSRGTGGHVGHSPGIPAGLFFDHWYCENSLPLQIVSDHGITPAVYSSVLFVFQLLFPSSCLFNPYTGQCPLFKTQCRCSLVITCCHMAVRVLIVGRLGRRRQTRARDGSNMFLPFTHIRIAKHAEPTATDETDAEAENAVKPISKEVLTRRSRRNRRRKWNLSIHARQDALRSSLNNKGHPIP